ncbi:hypothetical protein [Actinokineospora sp.]|uniref:hypothetical protein n=1 Tax=Actinokineospora sp. TaxID=1872133 RepID=UPI004037BB39
MSTAPDDPLAHVTLSPRRFAAVLATVGLLLGLLLALLPVRVAGPDPAKPAAVSCGNAIGDVETRAVVDSLGFDDRPTTVAYVDICERAISDRRTTTSLLFFGGVIGIVALGVVRRT